jgi:hypothetical protein
MKTSFVRVHRPSYNDLPACGIPAYLRGLAYVTLEMATTSNPRIRTLGARLLAMQAPTLAAIMTPCAATWLAPAPEPPVTAPNARRPKAQPCAATRRVACGRAACLRQVEGKTHIDSKTLELTCSDCCEICPKEAQMKREAERHSQRAPFNHAAGSRRLFVHAYRSVSGCLGHCRYRVHGRGAVPGEDERLARFRGDGNAHSIQGACELSKAHPSLARPATHA